jgi:K(+)-stimulated pyrophosphate-energized sodium pump
VAVSGGAVMGFAVVGFSLLGLFIVLILWSDHPEIVNGYAMGASLVALFGRSGGGIYTKGADMGADLVGKVEAGLPEDDPRNPAVIADNVGDNVGDVAGLGADLLESYVESIIASLAIAAGIGLAAPVLGALPLYIAAAGVVASMVGVFTVKIVGKRDAQKSLMMGTYVAAGLTILATYVIVQRFGVSYTETVERYIDGQLQTVTNTFSVLGPFWATLFGVVAGAIIGFVSEYFTSDHYGPVKLMAKNSQSGPAIAVTEGLAIGMKSTAIPTLVLAVAVVLSYHFAGMYGVALAALGMLATTGMIVSVDAYGPIADNAGGIAEMAKLDPAVRKITDNLDAVGNTTAAIGKGFAIGSAAFAALALLAAYMHTAQVGVANIANPMVLAGLLIGAMLPFLFSSMLFRAVSTCAFRMIQEVRRQFREIPGLREGTPGVKPDSATCVKISTQGALKGMLLPGALAILAPVIMGFIDKGALAGMLTGALCCGIMLGLQTANSGGAMDNSKKHIEKGAYGGKNSEAHKAAVIGDTVGDPLKDTVGPSINILIKLMCVIALVLAPLFR